MTWTIGSANLATGAVRAAVSLGLATVLSLAAIQSGSAETLRCEVPPLPICTTCVAKLALTLRMDGSCRAEWTGEAAAEAAFAQRPMTVEITIAGTRPAPFPRKVELPPMARDLPTGARSRRCFVHEHQRFCN